MFANSNISKQILDPELVETLAGELDEAERTQCQLSQFSVRFPSATVADSYAVQKAWVARKVSRGQRVIGKKIGLTSRSMQEAFGIDEPDYGILLDSMLFSSGDEIDTAGLIEPRIEAEIAFVLDAALGPHCTFHEAIAATRLVMPALEIIDARIERLDRATGSRRGVRDTIADNAANAAIVIGGRPLRPWDIDLSWSPTVLYRNGQIEESGVAAAVMGHPANAVAWLGRTMHRLGSPIEPGEIILSGSFIRPVAINSGDIFHADFGPLGVVGCRFR